MVSKENIEKTKQGAKKLLTTKFSKIESVEDLKSRILTLAFYGGVGLASWHFIIRPQWEQYRLKKANEKVLSDPNTQIASLLRQAIIGAGTNVTMVMAAAQRITDWEAVQNAYKALTEGNDLNQDLYEDLTSSQYQRFMDIVNHKVKINTADSKRGFIVISSKAIRLRNTPDSSKSSWSFNTNILDTVPEGKLLGFATGKYKVDKRGVLYYQVRIKYLSGIPSYHLKTAKELKQNHILTYWVGAGAISLIREFSQMKAAYPQTKIYKGTKDTGLRQALK